MWASIWTIVQAGVAIADARTLIEMGTIIFFGGAAWQQLRDVKQRITRIENKIFNGGSK